MEIGKEEPAIYIEPLEEPVPGHKHEPVSEPDLLPEPVAPEREPVKVPA